MTSPGKGSGSATGLRLQLMIERGRFGRWRGLLQGAQVVRGEVLQPENLPITPLEPTIFFLGDQNRSHASVASHRNRTGKSEVLIATDVALKFSRRDPHDDSDVSHRIPHNLYIDLYDLHGLCKLYDSL